MSHEENDYACSKRYDCHCVCSGLPSCSQLQGTVGKEGSCCSSTCCARHDYVYRTCRRRKCDSDGTNCRTETYTCRKRECVETSREMCQVKWGTCWTPTLNLWIHGQNRTLTHNTDCGFNDRVCVDSYFDKYPVDSTHICYVYKDEVEFSKPSDSGYVLAWIFASFGLICLAACLCLTLFNAFRGLAHEQGPEEFYAMPAVAV